MFVFAVFVCFLFCFVVVGVGGGGDGVFVVVSGGLSVVFCVGVFVFFCFSFFCFLALCCCHCSSSDVARSDTSDSDGGRGMFACACVSMFVCVGGAEGVERRGGVLHLVFPCAISLAAKSAVVVVVAAFLISAAVGGAVGAAAAPASLGIVVAAGIAAIGRCCPRCCCCGGGDGSSGALFSPVLFGQKALRCSVPPHKWHLGLRPSTHTCSSFSFGREMWSGILSISSGLMWTRISRVVPNRVSRPTFWRSSRVSLPSNTTQDVIHQRSISGGMFSIFIRAALLPRYMG